MVGDENYSDDYRLGAAEAAKRLGVKRATLYAYVSRGRLHRVVAADGRTSLFSAAEIEQMRLDNKVTSDGTVQAVISTSITRVDDNGLLIRGQDLVAAVNDGLPFGAAIDLLWETPPTEAGPHAWPTQGGFEPLPLADDGAGLDQLRILVAQASAADPLRFDLSPNVVRFAGRTMISAMIFGRLPSVAPPRVAGSSGLNDPWPLVGSTAAIDDESLVGDPMVMALWKRLSVQTPTSAKLAALDAVLALLVDHGLAVSTLAARVAASARADPYSVVSAAMGVIAGPLHGGASAEVHEMLELAERSRNAAEVVGSTRKRLGYYPGFGHIIYRSQDVRYGAAMARLVAAWGADPRLVTVYQARDLIATKTNQFPNIDLAVGALTYLAGMRAGAGEIIMTIARTPGWLAHAMEEMDERPLRFRIKAKRSGG